MSSEKADQTVAPASAVTTSIQPVPVPPPPYPQQLQQQPLPATAMNAANVNPNHTNTSPGGGPTASPKIDAHLLSRLRAQIEFYFSPQNLSRDNYLRSVLYHYGGAAAPLSVIASFPKVRELVSTTLGAPNAPADPSLLMRALEGSGIVAVTPDALWISPLLPMPPMEPHSTINNTRQFIPQNNPTMIRTVSVSSDAINTAQHPPATVANGIRSASPMSQHSQPSLTDSQQPPGTPNSGDDQQNTTTTVTKSERSTVILRDIPSDWPEDKIIAAFTMDTVTPKSARPDLRNTWYISFENETDALNAVSATRDKTIDGLPIRARIKSVAAAINTPPNTKKSNNVQPSPSDTKASTPQQQEANTNLPDNHTQMPIVVSPTSQQGRPPAQIPTAQYHHVGPPTITHIATPHGAINIPPGATAGAPAATYAAYPYNYRHYTPVVVPPPPPPQYPNATTYQHIPANVQHSNPGTQQPIQYTHQVYPAGYPFVPVQGIQGMNRFYGVSGPYRAESGGRAGGAAVGVATTTVGSNVVMAENGYGRQTSGGQVGKNRQHQQQMDNSKQARKGKLKKGFGSNQQLYDANGNATLQRWKGNPGGSSATNGNRSIENDSGGSIVAQGKGDGKTYINNRNKFDNSSRHRSQSELSEMSGMDSNTGDSKSQFLKKKKKNKKRDPGYNDAYRVSDKKDASSSSKPNYSFDASSFPALSSAKGKDKDESDDTKSIPQANTSFSGYADALRQPNKPKPTSTGTKQPENSSVSIIPTSLSSNELKEIDQVVASLKISNDIDSGNSVSEKSETDVVGPSNGASTTTSQTAESTPEIKTAKASDIENDVESEESINNIPNNLDNGPPMITKDTDEKVTTTPMSDGSSSPGELDKVPLLSQKSVPVTPPTEATEVSEDEATPTTTEPTDMPQSTWGNKRSFIDVVLKQP